MKILVAGDFCDKNRVTSAIADENFSLMFDGIRDVVHQADLRIVNFEFPIVEKLGFPIKKCGPTLGGQKKSIEAIKYAGFNVCTLANNHILDQGAECCLNTKRLLEDAHLYTVGVGENLNEASKVLYVEQGNETIAIINCCENEFSIATIDTPGACPLNPIRQYYQIKEARNKASYVLVIVHGGHEQFQLPSPRMKELYQYFINIGADAVINHHQHCYSGYEVFSEKPIFYGLGNLLFDWNTTKRTSWNEGFMVILDTKSNAFDLIPYIQSIDSPSVRVMDGEDVQVFNRNIDKFSSVISDDKLLEESINNYYDNSLANEISVIEPYQGRILRALFFRGLLPRLIREKKLLQILNHISCESHLDKLRYAIRKRAKM